MRKRELKNAIETVQQNRRLENLSEELNVSKTYDASYDTGWIRTNWISTYEVEIDMLAYFITTESANDPRMDIKIAFCNSKIQHARKENLSAVENKLKEIIEDATQNLRGLPNNGLPELQKRLISDGTKKLKAELQ